MPKINDIGFGDQTRIKIEHFKAILEMHLSITRAVLNNNKYYLQCYRYVELTAGKGITPHGKGSTLSFLELVENEPYWKPYRADFIEDKKQNIVELRENVTTMFQANNWDDKNIDYHTGKYEDIITKLFKVQNMKELGLVFVDHSGDLPNFDTLNYISHNRSRMEILVYISATNIKRLYHITKKHLSDYLIDIGKDFWLLRRPSKGDNLQWTFLLGSGCDIFKDYKKIGFIRLGSKEAQLLFDKLNLSERELKEKIQPKLF